MEIKPYAVKFRQKIIEVYETEKISVRKIAQRFRVAPSFIQKLLKQYKETGDIRPRRQGGSPPPKIKSEYLIHLMEIIEANPDATLEELCDLLAKKVQVRVS